MHLVGDQALQIRFKVCHARIADSKRKFFIAASSYYQLSNQENVNPDDLMVLLSMAATCAILSPAGPQKSRIISVLHKDARSSKLEQNDILEKMYLGKIIKRPEVRKFEDTLADHQRTVSQEGYSVLEKALIEHNIEVISKIYKNISFEELGRFLDIRPSQAETIIATMVSENRIKATLDQKSSFIEFEVEGQALSNYNSQVFSIC
jgi:COP9 signalosome complex subunit 4